MLAEFFFDTNNKKERIISAKGGALVLALCLQAEPPREKQQEQQVTPRNTGEAEKLPFEGEAISAYMITKETWYLCPRQVLAEPNPVVLPTPVTGHTVENGPFVSAPCSNE